MTHTHMLLGTCSNVARADIEKPSSVSQGETVEILLACVLATVLVYRSSDDGQNGFWRGLREFAKVFY